MQFEVRERLGEFTLVTQVDTQYERNIEYRQVAPIIKIAIEIYRKKNALD